MDSSKNSWGRILRRAFPDTLPVLAGYIFLGIAYGITMKAAGFGALWTGIASVAVYGGSMQFALVGLLQGAFAPLTVALMTLLIQARHIFYGLSMLEPYSRLEHNRRYITFALTDETYSLVLRPVPDGIAPWRWYTALSALDQNYWVTGSLIGAVLGSVLPFDLTGIDFAMTALFTVIVTEQCAASFAAWKKGEMSAFDALFPTLLGFGATLACLLIVGSGSFLVAAMLVMLVCFYARYRTVEGGRA